MNTDGSKCAYDAIASYYEELQARAGGRADSVVLAVLDSLELPRGALVVDAGCAGGRLSLELLRRGYRTIGLDQSLPLLEQAEEHVRQGLEMEQDTEPNLERQSEQESGQPAEPTDQPSEERPRYRFLQTDLLHSDLAGWGIGEKVKVVVAWLNTISHFPPDLLPIFWQQANTVLEAGGYLLLDAWEPSAQRAAYDHYRWAFELDGRRLIWQNACTPDGRTNRAELIWQSKDQDPEPAIPLTAWAYEPQELQNLAAQQGFDCLIQEELGPAGRWLYVWKKRNVYER